MADKNTGEIFQFGAKKEEFRKKWLDAMKMAKSVALFCDDCLQ